MFGGSIKSSSFSGRATPVIVALGLFAMAVLLIWMLGSTMSAKNLGNLECTPGWDFKTKGSCISERTFPPGGITVRYHHTNN